MSFRLKIILGIATIEAVLLLILIGSSLNLLKTSNEQELANRAYTAARLFATASQNAVLATDLASLHSLVAQVLTNPGVVYARILDRRGKVLAQGGEAKALSKPFVADKKYDQARHGLFNAYADIRVDGVNYGRVELGFATRALRTVLATARHKTLLIALTEMVLVALFSFVLGTYLTRGLKALKKVTQLIAGGELGVQIEARGRDELAQAINAFNDMSGKLLALSKERDRAEEELHKLNEDLERRVKQRTEQLAVLNKELEHQAMHDNLTKLPNRNLFGDRLQQAMLLAQREHHAVALMVIDMDQFKQINDSLGHHTGDLVLQAVASRLRENLRESDTAARMGGDEFAILLPAVADTPAAVRVVQRILKSIETPAQIAGHELRFSASVGIAMFPEHAENADILMRHADVAMYQAKKAKQGYTVYYPELDQQNKDRIALYGELRHAIETNELILHYQPKIDLNTEQLTGMEALVRWEHPRHGLLFPDDFIPLAEQSGLITPLTLKVLAMALGQCAEWRRSGLNLTVAVNISALNLQDPDLPDHVAGLLRDTGAQPEWLELEVTETALMTDPVRAIDAVTRLGALGVHIAIDDFGTGYSSLAYLKKLPVSKIKIDKSFVIDMMEDENSAVIVRSIIDLGHNLGHPVVAEGVENRAVLEQLKTLGCNLAQGYYLGRPMPPQKLSEWLKEAPWKPQAASK